MSLAIRSLIIALLMASGTHSESLPKPIQKVRDTLELKGNWQFFDTDSSFREIDISRKCVYTYNERSPTPEKMQIIQTRDTISFSSGETWIIKARHKNSIEVIKGGKVITVYRIMDDAKSVESFYEWYNEPSSNGNGVMIFERDMAQKKKELKARIKANATPTVGAPTKRK
jgi:hypothetical protein